MKLATVIKENELLTTKDINQALWLLPYGIMIDGEFDFGMRGQDHRVIECIVPNMNRYSEGFWDYIHYELRGIRLCPESNTALIKEGQKLTNKQKQILKTTNYIIECY